VREHGSGVPTDLSIHVEGFRQAAIAYYGTVVARNSSPDYALSPIAFLWRHHLELLLKQIIAQGRVYSGEDWGFPDGHVLCNL